MSLFVKALVMVLCINIMITIGGVSLGGDDALSKFIDIGDDRLTISSGLNDTIPMSLESGSINADAGGFSFIDGVRMVFGFIRFIFTIFVAPLYWGFALGFPLWLQIILFMPTILLLIGGLFVIRGSAG